MLGLALLSVLKSTPSSSDALAAGENKFRGLTLSLGTWILRPEGELSDELGNCAAGLRKETVRSRSSGRL